MHFINWSSASETNYMQVEVLAVWYSSTMGTRTLSHVYLCTFQMLHADIKHD